MSKYINKPNYINTSNQTLIRDIPKVLNDNNKENERLFYSIFNFAENLSGNIDTSVYDKYQCLIVPLITDGIVKGCFGEFKNLKFDTLDSSTSQNNFINIVTDHQLSKNRFSDELYKGEKTISDNAKKNYVHDAGVILYNNESLDKKISSLEVLLGEYNNNTSSVISKINNIQTEVDELYNKLNINKSREVDENISTFSLRRTTTSQTNNTNTSLVDAYNNSVNSYTYPSKVYSNLTNNINYINLYDEIDIKNGKKFRYYNVTDSYTKVNNQYPCALNTDVIGVETNILIDNISDKDLIIKLYYDGVNYNCIKVINSDIDLCRLTLTCVDINDNGVKWYLTNYNGKIEMIKI